MCCYCRLDIDCFFFLGYCDHRELHSFPSRPSSGLQLKQVKASQKSVEPELAKAVSPEANRSKFPSIAELEM